MEDICSLLACYVQAGKSLDSTHQYILYANQGVCHNSPYFHPITSYLAPCCPSVYAARSSKSIREDFTSAHALPKNAIGASMMSLCGTCAGGSIPLFPNCTVGGTSALGLIKRQVVPPFAGILTLSQTKI